jgi:hypothetical protein
VLTGDSDNLFEKLAAAARAQPKKAGVVGVLALTLLIMWARMLLTPNGGPASAGGAIAKVAQQSGNGHGEIDPSEAASAVLPTRATGRPDAVEVDRRLRDWLDEPIGPISRNLFTVRLDYFPPDPSRAPEAVKSAIDGEFWGRLEKSLMLQADQRGKRENLAASFAAEAGKMRLDSIIMGPVPKAMIDGKLRTEGDIAAGFRVLKIEPRRIMIEREGIRLEIQMK